MRTGYEHQCHTPSVWWSTHIRRSKPGRQWVCPTCYKPWRLSYINTHYVPGIVPWLEWQTVDRDKPEPAEEPHPEGDNYAITQLAGPQPVGFQIDMPNHDQ